jgi:hypothetical protein
MDSTSVYRNFVMSGGVRGVLDMLSELEGLINFKLLAQKMLVSGGPVSKICAFGTILLFLMLLIKAIQILIDKGFEFRFSDYIGLIGKTMLIWLFFGLLYPKVCLFAIEFSESMTNIIDLSGVRVELRKIIYSMQFAQMQEEKTDLWGRVVGKLYSILNLGAGVILETVVTVVMLLFLGLVFMFVNIGPFILLIALFMGPICMSMSLVFPSIGRSWANLLLGGVFLAFTTMLGLMVLVDSGMLSLGSYAMTIGQSFQILAFVIMGCAYLTFVPFLLGQLFSSSAFNFIGRVMGWLYGATVLLTPMVIMSEVLNYTVGESFSAKKNMVGRSKK